MLEEAYFRLLMLFPERRENKKEKEMFESSCVAGIRDTAENTPCLDVRL